MRDDVVYIKITFAVKFPCTEKQIQVPWVLLVLSQKKHGVYIVNVLVLAHAL
jgi:hypothetical protein